MELSIYGHEDQYAVEQLQLSLFATEKEGRAVSTLHRGAFWCTAVTVITVGGKETRGIRKYKTALETVRLRRQTLQQSYYRAALPHLPEAPPWGALAGVRPTKLTTKHLLGGGTKKSADRLLKDIYYVTPARRRLALECSEASVEAASLCEKNDISLYIGIPFCPTRCAYCSFVSRTVGKHPELMEPYLAALSREIEMTGALLRQSGFALRSVYMGGGTPTTLTCRQMEALLDKIRENFDLSRCLEFTVEAGRPDTVSEEKFRILREGGADRVSINPQTMDGRVLRACARPHTPEDILRRYDEARKYFRHINMDLIAGLPEDDFPTFRKSLSQVLALAPDNITVHTLALKKGAELFEKRACLPTGEEVSRMVEFAGDALRSEGYAPYYLYRQKYMSGSFENVGWCKPGSACLYNIYMMEELHTVVSLGGGGMNKVNLPDGSLQRFHNPKFPEQYIAQIDAVLADKEALFRLMKGSL